MNLIEYLKLSFDLENKDIFTIFISVSAFIVAFITFIFNIYHKVSDNNRAIRKELTDIIKELVEVNLAFNKLELEYCEKDQNNFIIEQRRTYNSRRRYLLEHGAFLAKKIPSLVSDIDYVVLGAACFRNGFTNRGIIFWEKAIKKASTALIRAYNIRGLATQFFLIEKIGEGRDLFEQSIALLDEDVTIDQDSKLDAISDTFLMWARSEIEIENFESSNKLYEKSKLFAEKIKNTGKRNKAFIRIKLYTFLENEG